MKPLKTRFRILLCVDWLCTEFSDSFRTVVGQWLSLSFLSLSQQHRHKPHIHCVKCVAVVLRFEVGNRYKP
jgi:hypothetical protein